MGERIPARRLQRDHCNMVRFGSRADGNYGVLSGTIKQLNSSVISKSRPGESSPVEGRSTYSGRTRTNTDVDPKPEQSARSNGNTKDSINGKHVNPHVELGEREETNSRDIQKKDTKDHDKSKGLNNTRGNGGIKVKSKKGKGKGVATNPYNTEE
jgi:hypothetical protein